VSLLPLFSRTAWALGMHSGAFDDPGVVASRAACADLLRHVVAAVPLGGPPAGAAGRNPAAVTAAALCSAAARSLVADIIDLRGQRSAVTHASLPAGRFPPGRITVAEVGVVVDPASEIDDDAGGEGWHSGDLARDSTYNWPLAAIRELLRDLARKYPVASDTGMLEALAAEPDEANVDGSGERGRRASLQEFLCMGVFGAASPHAPTKFAADVGAGIGGGTLYLALHHTSPLIRARAVRHVAAASCGHGGGAAATAGRAFARTSVLERLQDDDPGVVLAALRAAASLLPPSRPLPTTLATTDKVVPVATPAVRWASKVQTLLIGITIPEWSVRACVPGAVIPNAALAVAVAALRLLPRAAAASVDLGSLSSVLGLLPHSALLTGGSALMPALASEALCCLRSLGAPIVTASLHFLWSAAPSRYQASILNLLTSHRKPWL